jgi:hypothetical protein
MAKKRRKQLGQLSKKVQFLWILAPMRSGSSMLTHLLVDHPDINGFGECWIRYESESDFQELIARVYLFKLFDGIFRGEGIRLEQGKFVLDKILHNRLLSCKRLLNDPRLKLIFLLRQPQKTISSLLCAGRWFPHSSTSKKAANYYIKRLQAMERCASIIRDPSKSLILHYEHLIDRTKYSLAQLQRFLGVNGPLNKTYKLNIFSGIPGFGDPTHLIKTGKVVKKNNPPVAYIPDEILDKCNRTYQRVRQSLRMKQIIDV